MRKLILRIDDEIEDLEALYMAITVVKYGKISETAGQPQYCFHTRFKAKREVSVLKRPSGTETFYIR